MKKIIIALAVAAIAVVSEAAAIKWNSGTIYNQAGNKANASANLVTANLYMLTSEQYASIGSMSADEIYFAAKDGDFGAAKVTQNSTALGAININQTGLTGGTTENPQTYYGLVIYTDTKSISGDIEAYVKVNAQEVTFKDDGTVTLAGLATNVTDWTAASVPEPTSGLLMLVGLAGLALRRRRA
jgi:hypothetical protein